MLIDRENLPSHVPWIVGVLLAALLATCWFFWDVTNSRVWPSGSSRPGLTFGIAAGLIIFFEFLLWPRKMLRAWHIGRTQTWLRAHIWLGLLCLPLAIYHSGFRLGGSLSSALIILMVTVIASGIVGLLLQQSLPSRMLLEVPAETICSQIPDILRQLRDEAELLVDAVCGPTRETKSGEREVEAATRRAADGPLVVGSLGHVGGVQGRVLQTVMPGTPVPGSELFREFYHQSVEPFLQDVRESRSPLESPKRAEDIFQDLRTKLHPSAHQAAQALEGLCEQRRQLHKQARYHFWLHSWLWIHLPLSAGLLFLLLVHVCVALKYW